MGQLGDGQGRLRRPRRRQRPAHLRRLPRRRRGRRNVVRQPRTDQGIHPLFGQRNNSTFNFENHSDIKSTRLLVFDWTLR